MLISWEFSEVDLASCNAEHLENLIGELIRARRLGIHLVSISRNTANWLIQNLPLSDFYKRQLESFSRNYTQTGNYKKTAKCYIAISSIGHDYDKMAGGVIRMSIKFILNTHILEQPKIIFENIDNDGWFVDFSIRNVRRVTKFPKMSGHKLHGGGGDVVRVLAHEIDNKNIVCLVMDSDKKYPDGPSSQKVDLARKMINDKNWPLGFVMPTPCHEIENFVPLQVVKEMVKHDNVEAANNLETISQNERHNNCIDHDKYWRWFDVKNGIDLNDKTAANQKCMEWHEGKLGLIGSSGEVKNIVGFGENIIPRISAENPLQALLKDALNRREWSEDYVEYFSEISWILAAERQTVT